VYDGFLELSPVYATLLVKELNFLDAAFYVYLPSTLTAIRNWLRHVLSDRRNWRRSVSHLIQVQNGRSLVVVVVLPPRRSVNVAFLLIFLYVLHVGQYVS
jgi:hypothetical protein